MVPSSAKPVITPLLAFAVTSTVVLSFVAPAGMWVSNGAGWVVSSLLEISPTLTGICVWFNSTNNHRICIHHSMTPISLNNFALYGKDLLMPIMCLGNMAIAGATVAVWYKQRKHSSKTVIYNSKLWDYRNFWELPNQLCLVYLPNILKLYWLRVFAAGVFGAISATIDTHLTTYILSSIFSVPAYLAGGLQNFIQAIFGIIGVLFCPSY